MNKDDIIRMAQQEEPVTEDMKSAVRWAPSSAYWSQRLRELFGPDAREGIDALERRLAEAQQAEPVKPVAEVFVRRDGVSFAFWLKAPPPERTKLYTAPPQRKPLTEEVAALTAQRDALLEALKEAATSLETVGRLAGKSDYLGDAGERIPTYMGRHDEVREYATSRAGVARAAIKAAEGEKK